VTMSEWWTYRPSDFLMFSAGSYARLLEQFNQDFWPLHGLMLAVGLLLLAAAATPSSRAARWAPLALAAVWGWVAWAFLWDRFAEINTAASYLAVAFWVQAVLLTALPWRTRPELTASANRRSIAMAVVGAAVLLWPLLAPLAGRSWAQADYFGMAPEPTALATLAVVPVLSLVVGVGMLWLLYGPHVK
jgi:hypothetical protein